MREFLLDSGGMLPRRIWVGGLIGLPCSLAGTGMTLGLAVRALVMRTTRCRTSMRTTGGAVRYGDEAETIKRLLRREMAGTPAGLSTSAQAETHYGGARHLVATAKIDAPDFLEV